MRDNEDFDAFYLASSRRLIGQVFAMTGDLTEAEDAVAEAFARAWQRWSKVSAYGDPEAWVRTVAYRIAVSSWRRAVNRWQAHRRHGAPTVVDGVTPDQVALAGALQKIPASQRQAIALHYVVGLSVQEIADETRSPVGTVKTRLARGRQALSRHLDERADDKQPAGGL